jgi:peptidoglycan/LPS O-acetylase OafA/YrhL
VAGSRPQSVIGVPPSARTGVREIPIKNKAAEGYFPALTGLRFVLAAWVMLHHISGKGMLIESWANALPTAAASLVRGGYLAVQSFFILSGFVLAKTYANRSWSRDDLRKYAAARIGRIYPVYLLSLAVVAPFILQAMLAPTRTGAEKGSLLLNYAFVLQGWTGSLGVGWNTPAWSLSCEFFFYLCFPAILIGLRRAGRLAVVGIFAASLVLPVLLAHSSVPWTWKPIHHLSDFAAGVIAARLFDFLRPRAARRGHWLYLPAIALGALLIVFPQIMDGTYGDLNTGLRPLNVAALIGFALTGGSLATALSGRVLEYLGKISYSMYILHIPILWWYGDWAVHHLPGLLGALAYLALVTIAAAIAFEYVEVPANRWVRNAVTRKALPKRQTVLASAA